MTTNERLHRLLGMVPEDRANAVEVLLLGVLREAAQDVDPVLTALRKAPDEDEAISPAEERAVGQGRIDAAAGRVKTLAEVGRELLR